MYGRAAITAVTRKYSFDQIEKFWIPDITKYCPLAPIILLANKQDLCKDDVSRMNPKLIEDLLHIKTYGLTAINPTEKKKLTEIIEKELNHALVRRRLKESEF